MKETIEIRVWVLGQDEPTSFTAKNKKSAVSFVENLFAEMAKPMNEPVTLKADAGLTFINPRFVTKVQSSVCLVDDEELWVNTKLNKQ